MKQQQNCGSCRYFHNATRTWCQRYPPVPVDNRTAFYPAVIFDQWCGEWRNRQVNTCYVPQREDK